MDANDESVLEYARRCGIAVDHHSISPLSLIKHLRDSDSDEFKDDLDGADFSSSTTMDAISSRIRSEKIEVSKGAAAYLSTILGEISSITRGEKEMSEAEWCACFPDYPRRRKEDLKVDMPLLTSDEEKSMATFAARPVAEEMVFDALRSLTETGSCEDEGEGRASPEYFAALATEIEEDLQHEKLDCSRDAMAVLREALRADEGAHGREVDELVGAATRRPCRPISPLYLEIDRGSLSFLSGECQSGSLLDLPPSDSTDMALECHPQPWQQADTTSLLPDTGDVESILSDETVPSEVGLLGRRIGALMSTPDSEKESADLSSGDPSALGQPAADNSARLSKTGENAENFSPYSDKRLSARCAAGAFPTVPLKRKQSVIDCTRDFQDVRSTALSVDSSKRYPEQVQGDRGSVTSPRSFAGKKLSDCTKVSHVAALQKRQEQENMSVLGTLDSFMQIRGKTVKRRLNNASPNFTQSMIEGRAEPSDDQKESIERSAPEMPQVLLKAHVPDIPSSTSPSILVLSSALLQSDLDLVRHFERMGPTPQLIFREYQRNQRVPLSTTHTGLENEVDIIVSPQAGILLTTSQETTQTYLPGHPSLSRGYSSPLQERISRASLRYERLYILIRIPGHSIDARALSAISTLNGFCMTLGTCEVRPLLVALSDTERWISALACKEIINLPLPVEHVFPEGQEEETSWEVFLRQMGMNPFAARVVLAMATEDNEVSQLSAFVEMEPRKRRNHFGPVLGERVLRRIERVLEVDWQIDWAVDL